MSVQISYKKQIVFTLMFIFIVLAVVEGIARLYNFVTPICSVERAKPYQNYPEIGKEICNEDLQLRLMLDPITHYDNVLKPDQHFKLININSHGLRGPEYPIEKPENTLRVIIVGGSTVVDLRTPDNETIPSYLEQYYKQLHTEKNIQVINAGSSAFESTQELLWIKNKLLQYKPDLIIVYDGANDLTDSYEHPLALPASLKDSLIYQFKNVQAKYFPYYKTVDMFYSLSTNPANPFAKIQFDESNMQKKIERWDKNIHTICQLGKENNFKTVVALQPILGTGNKKLTQSENELFRYWNEDKILPNYDLFAERLDSFKTFCDSVVDLRSALDGINDDVFFDNVHISFKGNAAVSLDLFNITKNIVR